jgi:hypothetical protein
MWMDIGIVALLVAGVYAFAELVGWRTRMLTRRTTRTAEDMYDQYADSPREQRRYERAHGGEWTDEGGKAAPRGGDGISPSRQ